MSASAYFSIFMKVDFFIQYITLPHLLSEPPHLQTHTTSFAISCTRKYFVSLWDFCVYKCVCVCIYMFLFLLFACLTLLILSKFLLMLEKFAQCVLIVFMLPPSTVPRSMPLAHPLNFVTFFLHED